jgi:hypothetical protein
LINFNAFSQLSFRGHLGINVAKLNAESIRGQIKGSTGYNFGIDAQFGNKVYFQPGVSFNSKKFKIDGVGEINVNKFNIETLIGYRLIKYENNKSNNIRFFIGPNFSTTINEKVSEAITDIDNDDLKNINIGAIIGAGIDFNLFFIDIGYQKGLSNYISNNGKTARLNGFLVNLGIRF